MIALGSVEGASTVTSIYDAILVELPSPGTCQISLKNQPWFGVWFWEVVNNSGRCWLPLTPTDFSSSVPNSFNLFNPNAYNLTAKYFPPEPRCLLPLGIHRFPTLLLSPWFPTELKHRENHVIFISLLVFCASITDNVSAALGIVNSFCQRQQGTLNKLNKN